MTRLIFTFCLCWSVVAGARTLAGAATLLSGPYGIYVDTTNNEIGVANINNSSVTVYSRTATGNASPLRTIIGAATLLSGPLGIYVDTTNNEIGVANSNNNAVTVYSRTATGNAAPCSPSGMLFGPFGSRPPSARDTMPAWLSKPFDVQNMPTLAVQ